MSLGRNELVKYAEHMPEMELANDRYRKIMEIDVTGVESLRQGNYLQCHSSSVRPSL